MGNRALICNDSGALSHWKSCIRLVTINMPATAVTQTSIDLVSTMSEEVWNNQNYDSLDDLVSDDFVQHGPVTGMELTGRDELVSNIEQYHAAFSDLSSTVNLVFGDESGEYICGHFTNTGTHDGELMGIPATDVKGTVDVIGIYRIEDGKIAESWISADMFSLFSMIGTYPETDSFAA